ncbi:flagellar protein FlaG [Gammaproteobacteria bacterium]
MSVSLVTNAGVTAPTQPTGATRPVQDGTAPTQSPGTTSTPVAVVHDTQQTKGANGKGEGKDQPKREQVEQAVSSVNEYIDKLRHRELQFALDDKSGRMVVKVMDTETKKVIQQIPPEYMLRLADAIGKEKGWLVEQKA